jgi:hypothetical protein
VKNGDWNPPSDDLGAATGSEVAADNEVLALPEGNPPLPEGETLNPEYQNRAPDPREAQAVAGGSDIEDANPHAVNESVQGWYDRVKAKDQQKVEKMRPDLANRDVSPPSPPPSEEQIQESVDDYVDRTRNTDS